MHTPFQPSRSGQMGLRRSHAGGVDTLHRGSLADGLTAPRLRHLCADECAPTFLAEITHYAAAFSTAAAAPLSAALPTPIALTIFPAQASPQRSRRVRHARRDNVAGIGEAAERACPDARRDHRRRRQHDEFELSAVEPGASAPSHSLSNGDSSPRVARVGSRPVVSFAQAAVNAVTVKCPTDQASSGRFGSQFPLLAQMLPDEPRLVTVGSV